MKSYGKLYGDVLKYPHNNFFPIVEPGWTKETEEPFRDGKCVVFRLPWTKKGYVLGIWGRPTGKSETQALIEAIEARAIDLDVVRDLHDAVWAPEDEDDVPK
jgi:hypothetical protein